MRTIAFVLAVAIAAALIGLLLFYRPRAERPDRPSSTETEPSAGTRVTPTTDGTRDPVAPPDAPEGATTPDASDTDTPQRGVISGTVTDEMGSPVAEGSVYFVSTELFTRWLKDIHLPPFAQDEQEDDLDDDAPVVLSDSAFTLPYDAGESGMSLWAFAGPFRGLDADHEPLTQVNTTTDGTYVSGPLSPGTYTVIAWKRFHWPEVWQSIEVNAGTHVSGADFALKEQASISGVVVREAGVPVSGGWVETSSRSWEPTQTSEDGSFLIPGLRPGRYTVTADAEGLLRARLKVTAPSSDVRIVLRDGGTIRGRVIDKHSREPVETYWISWRRYDVTREDEETHNGGRFALTGLPSGLYNVEVRAPGYAPAVVKDIRVEAPHETDEVLVELVKGTTLAFTVVSADDNSAVIGARIVPISEWDVEQDALEVTTGEDGTCTFEHLRSRTYRFVVRHEEFAAQLVTVNVTAQDELKNVEVLLDKGLTLHGRVVTRDGQAPIQGAQVSLTEEGRFRASFTTTTDPEGAFSLTKVPPGHHTVQAAHAGYAFASLEQIFCRDFDEELTIELGPAVHLVVEVANADGTPHEGAGVMIFSPDVSGLGGLTDQEGRYVLGGCPPGRYHVRVGEAHKKGMGAFKQVDVPAGKETVLRFVLGGGARVHGTITLDGRPMEEMYVYVWPKEVTANRTDYTWGLNCSTDAHGRYSIPGLQPGEYDLRIWLDHAADTTGAVSGRGRNAVRRPFTFGTEDLELDIELGGDSVVGTVLDQAGTPLQDANVSIVPVLDEATRLDALTAVDCADEGWHWTDGDGRFTIMGLGEGTYRLLVTRHGYAPKTVLIEKHAGRDLDKVIVALEEQCSMRVRCRGADGRTPRRICLTIADEQGRFLTQESAYVDTETGEAHIEGLGHGRLTVVAQASGYAPCWSKVNVRPDVETVMDLELRVGWPVSVRVLDDGGSPVSGATVFLDPEGDPALSSMLASEERDAITDADGRACLEHVADGRYFLHVLHTASEPKTVDFQVSASLADTTVTLEPKRLEHQ